MPLLCRIYGGVDDAGASISTWLVVAAACGAYLAFSLVYLVDYPAVYADEPWVLATVVDLLRHGTLGLPMFREHYTAALYFTGYAAAPLGVLGISMRAARVVALLHGLGILILVSAIARQLAPPRSAWLAPALLLFLYPFATASRYFRPDGVAAFYSLLGVLLYLHARERRSTRLAFAAGCAAGFSFGLFLLSAWAVAVLAIWILLDLENVRRIAVAAAAGIAAALLPLVAYILATWHNYSRFMVKFGGSSVFAERHLRQGPFATLLDVIRREPQRYEHVLTWSGSHVYAVALVAAGSLVVASAIARRNWHVLALALVPPATIAALADNKTSLYLLPLVALLATLLPYSLPQIRFALPIAVVALALLVAVPFGRAVSRDIAPIHTSYDRLARAYKTAYPFRPGSVVIAPPNYYAYWMNDPNVTFYSFHVLTRFDDFELLGGAAARQVVTGLADGGRRVYLIYSPQVFFGMLAPFDFGRGPPRLPSLERFIRTSFHTVARVNMTGFAFGDVSDRIAVYERRRASRRPLRG